MIRILGPISLSFLLVFGSIIGCRAAQMVEISKTQNTEPPKTDKPNNTDSNDKIYSGNDDGASADPPQAITGTYLFCSMMEDVTMAKVDVSCRFNDSKAMRVPVASIAKRVTFSFENHSPDVIVKTILLESDPEYDVRYKFSGLAIPQLKVTALSTTYQADLFELSDGTEHVVKSQAGSIVIQDTKVIASTVGVSEPGITSVPVTGIISVPVTGITSVPVPVR